MMKLKSYLEELPYTLIQGDTDADVEDVVYDSRKAAPDTVFVCMSGSHVDSHDFIPDVIAAGCRAIVVEHEVKAPEGVTLIKVENGREALSLMSAARFGYPSRKLTMIGVTGTKGKTTTTHMIRQIFEDSGKKAGLIGTNGVMIGNEHYPTVNTTPESYDLQRYFAEMVDAGCECCVMEVSSQAFKMHRVDGIVFDYCLFTNISPDHIGPDEHADFDEYLYYKKQIFKQSRHALINMDDEHIDSILEGIECEWEGYALEHTADYMAVDIHYISEPDFVGTEFSITGKADLNVRVGIPGRFNVYNALAAASVCLSAGIAPEYIRQALKDIKIDGRMEIVYTCSDFCVLVDYAHNAVSMESLLNTLRDYNPKRLVVVFGCGGNRSKDRRYTMGDSAGRLADFSIITADNSRYEKVEDIIADIHSSIEKTGGEFIEIPDRREAITYSMTHAQPGDMIAVIGKGHEDYQEVNGVRHHFLDREVIQEVAATLGKDQPAI